ncbi:MAG: hypothetical protein C0464_02130, partial [Cyanobacteria bacterium DS2.008]|nr:hypothetical protein [Cyanobacteria bacterium DS2.008]
LGISDIYHSPWFLALTATLTLNMIVVSFQRVFPKLKLLKNSLPFFRGQDILKLPVHYCLNVAKAEEQTALIADLSVRLTKMGYKVKAEGSKLKGEYGLVGRLAPSVTHVGLLTLLLGITITSWTGFTGFQPVLLDEKLNFSDSQHSKLWIGSLPKWQVRVDGTRRETIPVGKRSSGLVISVWLMIKVRFFIKAKYRSIIHLPTRALISISRVGVWLR